MKEVLISARNVEKEFKETGKKNIVIDNVNLDIYKGDFTVIMGSSGAGKSTLLYILSGMENINHGKVLYKNKDITKYCEKQMAKLRTNEFGFVFQQTYLVSNITLFENVAVAGFLNDDMTEKQAKEKAIKILESLNITDSKNRLPMNCSGGELQRAAIARAIINNPSLLFADEPTGALNKNNTNEVLNLLTNLNNENQSILMVTHDVRAASRGNRILYLEDGKIIGEKDLPKFTESEQKEREEELNKWLSDLEW